MFQLRIRVNFEEPQPKENPPSESRKAFTKAVNLAIELGSLQSAPVYHSPTIVGDRPHDSPIAVELHLTTTSSGASGGAPMRRSLSWNESQLVTVKEMTPRAESKESESKSDSESEADDPEDGSQTPRF